VIERVDAEVRRELGRFGPIEGDTAAIARVWARAVGDTIARNAWPARVARDGTLQVATVSSTWAFELGRLAETVLEQLRAELGPAAPRALSFAPGPVPEPAVERAARAAAEQVKSTPEDAAAAADIAAGIADDELRRLVARAAAASLAGGRREAPDDRRF
jgi:hypothetical protein